ncbi:alkaline-phosphatase-like protein [Aspergillus ambiguus]|uniref:alkaline-phosphatase-like protein n=1 Tax=Aspergillus ambiguus TaxID=176160 RepID=UPI003CCDFFD9
MALFSIPPKPSPLAVSSKNGGDRPNYVIFMPDQLRYDSLGCITDGGLGYTLQTSMLFASVCSQSRCSTFTGCYPMLMAIAALKILSSHGSPISFDTFAPTVTELSVTEYGFLETPEFTPKFSDIWGRLFYKGLRNANEALDYDEAVVRSALTWLEYPLDDKPWVLFMPLIFPHCPFQVEEPYFSMYDRPNMSDIVSKPDNKTGYEPRYMKIIRERYGTDRATDEIWREVKATYFGMISRLDDQFGRVVNKLDKLHLWEDTVTMFFIGHGEYLGDHGLIEKWPSGLSETLLREPLIIGGAGLPKEKTITAMTEMVDLVPTMLELSGIGEHFPHNGKSWIPILVGSEKKHKDYAFSEGGFLGSEEPLLEQTPYPYDIKAALQHEDVKIVGKSISLRDESYTFIYRLYEPAELYHRISDPHEMYNLASESSYTLLVSKYQKEVIRWLVQGDFLPWQKDDRFPEVNLVSPREQMKERLRRLRE